MSASGIVPWWLSPLVVAVALFASNLSAQTALPNQSIFEGIYNAGVYNGEFANHPYREYFEGVQGNTVLNATGTHLVSSRMFQRHLLGRMYPDMIRQHTDAIYRGQACKASCRNMANRNATVWGDFSQNWATQADVGTRSSYEYRPFAFTFGQERRIGRWFTGIAAQYSYGKAKGGNLVWTETQLDAFAVGLYGGYYSGCDYLKGNMQLGIGWNKEDSFDRLLGTKTRGSFHSSALGTGLEFGRRFDYFCEVNPLTITPHVGADYWFLNRETFDETGTNPRSFDEADYHVVEIPVGLRIARAIPMAGGKANWITPSVDLTYARSLADATPSGRVGLVGVHGTWHTHGTEPGRDIFRMNAAVTGKFRNHIDVGVGFAFETRNHYSSEQINVTLAVMR